MQIAEYEVPVAHSMVAMARHLARRQGHPLEAFTCYWAAFNNIYIVVAERRGLRPRFRRNGDGSIRTRTVGQVNVPEVTPAREREQIDMAVAEFTDDLKRRLVEHPSARFFAYRTPQWHGQPIERDAHGQRLNGVLNVGYTRDAKDPVWTPVDTQAFEEYHRAARDVTNRDVLARQIVDVLYTVRNNTFHGGKSPDDANDREVLEMALPLLVEIVESFVGASEAA
jgi:hypothetical protein